MAFLDMQKIQHRMEIKGIPRRIFMGENLRMMAIRLTIHSSTNVCFKEQAC